MRSAQVQPLAAQIEGRNMKSVQLEVKLTNRCNQRCFHCMNCDSPDGTRVLDVAAFSRRVEEFIADKNTGFTIGEVRITGGEPLLYPGEVKTISSVCKRHGILCGVNTNGTLLTPVLAAELYESGITTIKISLDAVEKDLSEQITGSGTSVDKALSAIRIAHEQGIRTIVRFTLSRKNENQLRKCYQRAIACGASEFQIKPLIRSGRALYDESFLSKQEINMILAQLSDLQNPEATNIVILCWVGKSSDGLKYKLCGSANKIYIDETLGVTICNYVSNAPILGDLSEDSLQVVLRKRVMQLAKTVKGPIVKDCPHIASLQIPQLSDAKVDSPPS